MRRLFRKLLRDLWVARGRTAFMVLALAAGLTSLGTVLSMRSVLRREMRRNYLETVPASATFDVGGDGVSRALLDAVRARPEVAAATRRATLTGRWRARPQDAWGRALLFVREDLGHQELALVQHERGADVPPPGSVLVERSALGVLGRGIGETIEVEVAGSPPVALEIAGVVHEPALAPAATEEAGYLYLTPETLALLGQPTHLDELRVLVADAPLDAAAVTRQVEALGTWIEGRGVALHEIRMPPPGMHPHESVSKTMLLLLAIFAALTLVLAAVLTASLLSLSLARQVREVAVMRSLGASRRQIQLLYAGMLLVISTLALVLAAAATQILGRFATTGVAGFLNFDIASYALPPWVHAVQLAAGLLVPLAAAAPILRRAGRIDIRSGLEDHGARAPTPSTSSARLSAGKSRLLLAALRNAVRVPRRLALTLGLLATGGALFISAASVADAWDESTSKVFTTRHYDVELQLAAPPMPVTLAALPSAQRVELWGRVPVTGRSSSNLPLSTTYPDGGHGSFNLTLVPDRTDLIDFDLLEGQWLGDAGGDDIVLNQLAAARFGAHLIGRELTLMANGQPIRGTVVGVVEEVAAPATAYMRRAAATHQVPIAPAVLRIATTTGRDPSATRAAIASIEEALTGRGARIVEARPLELLFNAMGEHVIVLIRLLLGLALLMAAVGALALGSTMSTSVIERTREIGVLQAVGARPAQVRRMILVEGLFAAGLSLPLAVLGALPIAAAIGRVVGQLAFRVPLGLNVSWTAVAIWSVGVLAISAIASLAPAQSALKRTVRAALAYV